MNEKVNFSEFKKNILRYTTLSYNHWFGYLYNIILMALLFFGGMPILYNIVDGENVAPIVEWLYNNNFFWVMIGMFLFDFFLGLFTADEKYRDGRKSYIKHLSKGWTIIDLLAITFAFIPVPWVQVLVSIKLLRLIYILNNTVALTIIFLTFKRNGKLLLEVVFIAFIIMFIFAFIVFGVDNAGVGDQFGLKIDSYWDAFYFVVVTATTLGFGDIVPLHGAARALTIVIVSFGVLMMAMVTAIAVQGFIRHIRRYYEMPGINKSIKIANLKTVEKLERDETKTVDKYSKDKRYFKAYNSQNAPSFEEMQTMSLEEIHDILNNEQWIFPPNLNKEELIVFIEKHVRRS